MLECHDFSSYLTDISLGKFFYFPEISKSPEWEANSAIKIDSIQAIAVEKRIIDARGLIYELSEKALDSLQTPLKTFFAVFALTKERRYCVSSFYESNEEANFLLNLILLSMEEKREINWQSVRETLILKGQLKGQIK